MCCIILCAVVFLMLTLFCAIVFKKQIASNNANMDPYTIDIRDIRMSASISIYPGSYVCMYVGGHGGTLLNFVPEIGGKGAH